MPISTACRERPSGPVFRLHEISGRAKPAICASEGPSQARYRSSSHPLRVVRVARPNWRAAAASCRLSPRGVKFSSRIVSPPSRSNVEDLQHCLFDAARPRTLWIRDRFGKPIFSREWLYACSNAWVWPSLCMRCTTAPRARTLSAKTDYRASIGTVGGQDSAHSPWRQLRPQPPLCRMNVWAPARVEAGRQFVDG